VIRVAVSGAGLAATIPEMTAWGIRAEAAARKAVAATAEAATGAVTAAAIEATFRVNKSAL